MQGPKRTCTARVEPMASRELVGGRELPCRRINPQRFVGYTLSTPSNFATREPVVEINCDTRTLLDTTNATLTL